MEQPIVDTTTVSNIKEGMWCEARKVSSGELVRGELYKNPLGHFLVGEAEDYTLIIYRDKSLNDDIRDMRVWEHKPELEYPTENGFYRFDGSVYLLRKEDNTRSWELVQGIYTGNYFGASTFTDNEMRAKYPDISPIPYKLVPTEEK